MWITIVVAFCATTSGSKINFGSEKSRETTEDMLKALFRNYDRHQPPIAPDSTPVEIGIYINSIYSISEQQMEYSLNIYLRQSWTDPRLAFNRSQVFGGKSHIQLSSEWIEQVWRPDIFFRNEKKANFHHVTIPNLLFRLFKNGDIWYVTKISATLSCMMNLRKYPLDTQNCPMMLESFGHTADYVNFKWMNLSVELEEKLTMPQFRLIDWRCINCTKTYATGTYPCLQANFILKRDFFYFLSQLYVPTILIVILSWVGFWINIDAIPARVSLGLLTVLTMTTQSSGANSQLPRVSYVKAIDVWTSICLLFVFVSLLEFAVVNVVSRKKSVSKSEVACPSRKKKSLFSSPPRLFVKNKKTALFVAPGQPNKHTSIISSNEQIVWLKSNDSVKQQNSNSKQQNYVKINENIKLSPSLAISKNDYPETSFTHNLKDNGNLFLNDDEPPRLCMNNKIPKAKKPLIDYKERARKLDKLSRYIFPLCFLIFNFIYWIYYTQVPLNENNETG